MGLLTLEQCETWLDAYGAAWQAGDPHAAVELFADDAEYYKSPFDDPMIGKEAIFQYWSEGAGEAQKDSYFSYQVLAVVGNSGLAHWWASFVRIPAGTQVYLDGILLAKFSDIAVCSVFREWWHRRESEGKANSS